jgi:pantothenate kinase
MSFPEVQRDLGALEARMDTMEREVAALREDMREVLAILNQTKGSWRTLVAIAGISASVGAAAAKLLPYLMSLPR